MAPIYKSELTPNKSTSLKQSHKSYATRQFDGMLADETYTIVRHVVYSLTDRPSNSSSRVAMKFRQLVEDMLNRHDVFNCICANLDLSPSNIARDFNGVAESVFEDNRINWGRLVALVGFSVKVAEYFRNQGYLNHEDTIVHLTSNFIVNKTGAWIVDRGGWGDVVSHFAEVRNDTGHFSFQNDRWFKGILVTATAAVGLGALFAVACK